MKSTNKKKGYVLVFVMVLSFIMTVTLAATFTIVMRYMFIAKNNLHSSITEPAVYHDVEEIEAYGWF